MKIQDSYFVKFANGTSAWLAVGKPVPADAELVEVRPMIMPGDGMILRHKETGEESSGHWLRGDDTADKWEEIEEPAEQTEIHFRADAQATIEAMSGYASKWGASSTSIFFDL